MLSCSWCLVDVDASTLDVDLFLVSIIKEELSFSTMPLSRSSEVCESYNHLNCSVMIGHLLDTIKSCIILFCFLL